MKTNIGKLGMLLTVFLLGGSVFAGSVTAQPSEGYIQQKRASEDYTPEELAKMSSEELAKIVPEDVLEIIKPEELAKLPEEELELLIPTKPLKPTFKTSKDYTAKELADMPTEELASLVPKDILTRHKAEDLAKMTEDELKYIIPTQFPRKEWIGPKKAKEKFKPIEPIPITSREGKDKNSPWVIVYAPHPDDETYGLGGWLDEIDKNYVTLVVLFTRGEASSACGRLGLSPSTCGQERLQEFLQAMAEIGVDYYAEYNYGDGDLSFYDAYNVMDYYEDNYNVYKHVATSRDGPHPDHDAEALALHFLSGASKDWYRVYTWHPEHSVVEGDDDYYYLTSSNYYEKQDTLWDYRHYRYGIAYESTPTFWEHAWSCRQESFDTDYD